MTVSPATEPAPATVTLRQQAAARVAVKTTRARTMRAIVALAASHQATLDYQIAMGERDACMHAAREQMHELGGRIDNLVAALHHMKEQRGTDPAEITIAELELEHLRAQYDGWQEGRTGTLDAIARQLSEKDLARQRAAAEVVRAMKDLGARTLDSDELIGRAEIPGLEELLEIPPGLERIHRASQIEQAAIAELERAQDDLRRIGCSRAEDFALMQLFDAERKHELTRKALEHAETAGHLALRALTDAQASLDRIRLEITSPAAARAGEPGGADGDASGEPNPGDQQASAASGDTASPETASSSALSPRIPENPATESATP